MNKVQGEFKIQMEPHAPAVKGHDQIKTGRLSFRKAYSGPLEAIGLGEMLSVHCAEPGYAGYTAIEQIKGSLEGRKGSFVIQHYGIKTPDSSELRIDILPGSGAEGLQGIQGHLIIRTEGKQHHYELNYEVVQQTENA